MAATATEFTQPAGGVDDNDDLRPVHASTDTGISPTCFLSRLCSLSATSSSSAANGHAVDAAPENDGFYGEIKHAPDDFIVREVDATGGIVDLTNQIIPPTITLVGSSSGINTDDAVKTTLATEKPSVTDAEPADNFQSDHLDADTILKLKNFLLSEVHAETKADGGNKERTEIVLDAPDDKEDRKNMHNAIRECFRGRLFTSSTCDDPRNATKFSEPKGAQQWFIVVSRQELNARDEHGGGSGARRGGRGGKHAQHAKQNLDVDSAAKSRWLHSRYLHFTLRKRNCDTAEAVMALARQLRIDAKRFQYAGVKDRRADTYQRISVRSMDAQRLIAATQALRGCNVSVGNFSYEFVPLKLGSLRGNHFDIRIRSIQPQNRPKIESAFQQWIQTGFINYFGPQRFGTTDIGTHEVGRALLKSDWSGAIDLLLMPRASERNERMRAARLAWTESRNAQEVLDLMPNRRSIEATLLQGLAKRHANDTLGALNSIPRNSRQLYVHSYQSWVWNRAVTYRLEKFGPRPIVGDLVALMDDLDETEEENDAESGIINEYEDGEFSAKRSGEHQDADRKRHKIDADGSIDGEAENGGGGGGKAIARVNRKIEKVSILTEDNVGRFTIFDVVLPLPGFDIEMPNVPEVCQFMLNVMQEDEIDLTKRHRVRDYSLPGAYRRICEKVKDAKLEFIPTDSDSAEAAEMAGNAASEKDFDLRVGFSLGNCCYATTAMRELMKRQPAMSLPPVYVAKTTEDGERVEKVEADDGNLVAVCV